MKDNLFPQISKHNQIELYFDGPDYCFKYLELIRSAVHCIHLQTYIFHLDEFGSCVHKELIAAARRGVKVYLLIDSVGSRFFEQEDELALQENGIYFSRFNGIKWDWFYRWGRRLHHKVLLVDQSKSIIGGINVISPCAPGAVIPKLDFAVYMEGNVNKGLTHYCQSIFKASYKKQVDFESLIISSLHQSGAKIEISVNDWVHRRRQITKQYYELTRQAQKEIIIINSYFFPRRKFMKKLVKAAKRGVKVSLILPKYSDWPSYILASEYLYEYFLKRGVNIYLWNKSILHGKLAVVDESWSTIGSFNLNYTSYQQNLEMNVDIYSKEFIRHLRHEIDSIIADGCEKIDKDSFIQKAPLTKKAKRFIFYIILSLIAGFSIGLNFQEDKVKENRLKNILRIIFAFIFFVLGAIGFLLPIIPGFPFLILSFFLVYRQILLNKKLG